MKVAVTGAQGFIGRYAVMHLAAQPNTEVLALSRMPFWDGQDPRVRSCAIDLMDCRAVNTFFRREKPSHLLHLAWDTAPGSFWSNPNNLDWVGASLQLQRAMSEGGGKRIVSAGSCAEYDWNVMALLTECDTPKNPATYYGLAKDALSRLSLADPAPISAAWGRVFWIYGPGEKRGRLVSDLAANLVLGYSTDCSDGHQARDFLHVDDVARAFVAALSSDWEGPFNIGSGVATPVRDVVNILAEEAGRPDLVRLGARPTTRDEPPCLVADIGILRDRLGFVPAWDLRAGLRQTYRWWAAAPLDLLGMKPN